MPESNLSAFTKKFDKLFGAGTLQVATDIKPYEIIPTGSLTLDYVLGVGGLVEGRVVEVWGPDGVGKTTLALVQIAEAQRKHPKKRAAFIDMEQKLDHAWAIAHGVDMSKLFVYQPNSAEDVADALKEIVRSGEFSIVVLDSIGAMIPEKEKEKDAEEATMAIQAKIVTRMVKIAAVEARRTSTVVYLLNQVRANLSYGADTTTGGGFALRHVSTMKFKLRRTSTMPYKTKILGEDRVVGHEIAVTVERNGVAPAYRTATMALFHVGTEKYGPIGIDKADEACTLGMNLDIIQGSGWYTLPGVEDKINGREKVVAYLREHPEMVEDIRQKAVATRASEVKEEDAMEEPTSKLRKGKPA